MKVRNYERKDIIAIAITITIILEIVVILALINKKEYSYQKIPGIIIKKDFILVMVNKEEKKILGSNKKLFIDNKEKKYRIEEDRGIIMHKNNQDYYEIVINTKTSKEYNPNDIVNVVVRKTKHKLIGMFKIIWEGDENDKNKTRRIG